MLSPDLSHQHITIYLSYPHLNRQRCLFCDSSLTVLLHALMLDNLIYGFDWISGWLANKNVLTFTWNTSIVPKKTDNACSNATHLNPTIKWLNCYWMCCYPTVSLFSNQYWKINCTRIGPRCNVLSANIVINCSMASLFSVLTRCDTFEFSFLGFVLLKSMFSPSS